jgi:NAD(P)-dependent dehydrogenase (short-subunit alcohol dehydrogenase family)
MVDFAGYDKDFRLDGKVALITGGAAGIGRAIADLYADKGADLVLVDLSESVRDAASELAGRGVKTHAIVADLTTGGSPEAAVAEALSVFGKIDILVNNAGVVLLDAAEALPEDYWDRTMAINLKVPFQMSQLVGREMIKAGGGKIVNLASQAGVVALNRHVAYCASKGGIIMMTRVLALEWGRYGIRVNAISPTVTLTELGRKAWSGQVAEDFKKMIPAGRFAYPEEIAAVALFLASQAADMINGENVLIDGGYSIS